MVNLGGNKGDQSGVPRSVPASCPVLLLALFRRRARAAAVGSHRPMGRTAGGGLAEYRCMWEHVHRPLAPGPSSRPAVPANRPSFSSRASPRAPPPWGRACPPGPPFVAYTGHPSSHSSAYPRTVVPVAAATQPDDDGATHTAETRTLSYTPTVHTAHGLTSEYVVVRIHDGGGIGRLARMARFAVCSCTGHVDLSLTPGRFSHRRFLSMNRHRRWARSPPPARARPMASATCPIWALSHDRFPAPRCATTPGMGCALRQHGTRDVLIWVRKVACPS